MAVCSARGREWPELKIQMNVFVEMMWEVSREGSRKRNAKRRVRAIEIRNAEGSGGWEFGCMRRDLEVFGPREKLGRERKMGFLDGVVVSLTVPYPRSFCMPT